jgi:hypothetical protein
MAKVNKNTARLILRGIGALGVFLGFSFIFVAVAIIIPVGKDTIAIASIRVISSITLLVLSAYLISRSYLMFRGRAPGGIRSIPGVLAFLVFGLVAGRFGSFAMALVTGVEAKTIVGLVCSFAALLLSALVYLICAKLLKGLAEAYSSEDISGTRRAD